MNGARLGALVALTMVGFAANSVLNRMALAEGDMGALGFAQIRVVSGAVVLLTLCLATRRRLALFGWPRAVGALALAGYLLGFSLAYTRLDAGLGALILFGMVQVTMFGGAVIMGEAMGARRWIGMALAGAGLLWLLWPGAGFAVSGFGAVAMGIAGGAWGVYSLIGRRAEDALAETAANFFWAMFLCAAAALLLPGATGAVMTGRGVALAVLSGAVTSGLGYALWYALLPWLAANVAGLVQLSVPVIAVLGGAALLGELPGVRVIAAGALVLGGIALGLLRVAPK